MVRLCEVFCKKIVKPDVVAETGTIQVIDTQPTTIINNVDTIEPAIDDVSADLKLFNKSRISNTDTIDGKPAIDDANTDLQLNQPNKFYGKKQAIITSASEEFSLGGIIEVYEKDEYSKNLIREAIGKNDFLTNMMDADRLEAVTMAMYPEEFEKGQYIIREGEAGDHLFISVDGTYDVLKKNIVVKNFGGGVAFGELGILYKARRFASIRARSTAKVWILPRTVFHRIMIKLGREEREEKVAFLKSVDALTGLSDEKYGQVADLLKRQFYTAGIPIVKQGDEGNLFYIIRAGTVRVVKRGDDGHERVVNTLKRGDCFGEQALINSERRLATVIAEPPGTECLILDRVAFEEYLGPLEYIKSVPVDVIVEEPLTPTRRKTDYGHVKFSDLRDIKTLGVGSYGRVQLVEYQHKKFALKYLKKHEIVQMQYEKHVYNEKDIMSSCDSSFIVKFYKTFRDSKYLYFLMEACLGGDLWTVLHNNGYFDETTARFVIACVIEGLEYLHSREMIYRDLKPENLMIDETGYIKLVDFGFARRLKPPQMTNTFVGTPEYVAPEIILGKGHDRAVDYWAMGILIHELLSGKPAFRGKDHIKTYNLIIRGIDVVVLPSKIQRTAQDLIKKLCRKIPTERLGYAKNGEKDIKDHGWFNGFIWERIRDRTMKAPRQLSHPAVSFEVYPDDDDNPPDETSGWDIYF